MGGGGIMSDDFCTLVTEFCYCCIETEVDGECRDCLKDITACTSSPVVSLVL